MTKETCFEWSCDLRGKVFREAHAALGRKWTENGYTDVGNLKGLPYKLMQGNDNGIAGAIYRDYLADLFAEWICEKAGI